jgi:hypothetical protein
VARLSITDGFQVPSILLTEVVGNAGTDSPVQYDSGRLNVGTIFELMVIVSDVVVAHCPSFGVKV